MCLNEETRGLLWCLFVCSITASFLGSNIYLSFFLKGKEKKERERLLLIKSASTVHTPFVVFFSPETHTKAAHKMNYKEDGNKEIAKKIMSNTHPTPSNICD